MKEKTRIPLAYAGQKISKRKTRGPMIFRNERGQICFDTKALNTGCLIGLIVIPIVILIIYLLFFGGLSIG